jgi:hypothetical protein
MMHHGHSSQRRRWSYAKESFDPGVSGSDIDAFEEAFQSFLGRRRIEGLSEKALD